AHNRAQIPECEVGVALPIDLSRIEKYAGPRGRYELVDLARDVSKIDICGARVGHVETRGRPRVDQNMGMMPIFLRKIEAQPWCEPFGRNVQTPFEQHHVRG